MSRLTLQIGDVIDWDGESKTVAKIIDGYAVWYADRGPLNGKMIARCRIFGYGDSIRLVRRNGQPCTEVEA